MEWNKSTPIRLRNHYSALLAASVFCDESELPAADDALLVLVDIQHQYLQCFKADSALCGYRVSTALNGSGCSENSNCTPLGWHRIAGKIGGGAPLGTIFKARVAGGVANSLSSDADDDLVTSRILWLSGLQPAVNNGGAVDSYSRYIYIHGTAQEHLIGSPVSHGCIRMRNKDVIALYDIVDENSVVVICENLQDLLPT